MIILKKLDVSYLSAYLIPSELPFSLLLNNKFYTLYSDDTIIIYSLQCTHSMSRVIELKLLVSSRFFRAVSSIKYR